MGCSCYSGRGVHFTPEKGVHFVRFFQDSTQRCLNPPITPFSGTTGTPSKCTIPTSEVGLENSITQIENEISNLIPIDSTNIVDRKDLYDLLICLKRLKMELIRSFVSNDNEDKVETRFSQEEDPFVRTYAYSHLVNTNHYSEASSFLNGVQDSNTDWLDFKQAQLINLRRLQDYNSFSATAQEVDFLYNAGNQHTFYATWIRSIYTAVSDDVIVFELPNEFSIPRGDNISIMDYENVIHVSPNPATDDIRIAGLPSNVSYVVKICDITGALVKKKTFIKGDQSISIADFSNGLYVIQIFDTNSNIVHVSKIVKTN